MTQELNCSTCGTPIPPDARQGLCPKCLMGLGFPSNGESSSGSPGTFNELGHRFGKYQLSRQLGRGGMGVVYEATDLESGRTVALKMILDNLVTSPEAIRRFLIEIDAARRLNHPNIVPVYEAGEAEGQPFFAMKLIEGDSLKRQIDSGQFCPPRTAARTDTIIHDFPACQRRAAQLIATLARAVQHAHDKGVLHRDLKPGNVLIDADGQPQLTDFGLAKLLDDAALPTLTATLAALGTPPYMSPEQASGQRLGKPSDIYSLGAILYELLTGQPPFKGETHLATIQDIISKPLRNPRLLNSAMDKTLDSICCKCLEKNPAARYSSAEALAEDLENWLAGRRTKARPPSPVVRARRWVKNNPVPAGLILSLFLGMVLSAALSLFVLHNKIEDEKKRKAIVAELGTKVDNLWETPGQVSVTISPLHLSLLGNLSAPNTDTNTPPLTFGINITESPVAVATCYAPFLRRLEKEMEKRIERPVSLALRLYKPDSPAMIEDALRTNDLTHLIRISPVSYAHAKRTTNGLGLEPIAGPICKKIGVIYARRSIGVSNLFQAKGKGLRIGFAHTNAVISVFAKVELAKFGIYASDFSLCTNLPLPTFSQEGDLSAHNLVKLMVETNALDLGPAERRHFLHKQAKLVELHSFEVWEDIHVASPSLPSTMMTAFRQSLAAIQGAAFTWSRFFKHPFKTLAENKTKKMLEALHGTKITGFMPITDTNLNFIRAHLTNEYARFEGTLR